MEQSEEKILKTTIYLHKEEAKKFEDCLKNEYRMNEYISLKEEIGLEGRIYVDKSDSHAPKWQSELNCLASQEVSLTEGGSNKVVVICKVNNQRYMTLVYGYGKAMLDDSSIERNFGFKVAANLISPTRILTMDATVVESNVVNVAKQSYKLGSLGDFQMDTEKDILRGIMGDPGDDSIARMLYGKDSLIATKKMDIHKIKDSLEYYLSQYGKDTYKRNGFAWVDNIMGIKDPIIIGELNSKLVNDIVALKENPFALPTNLTIAPNQVMDWQNIGRIYIDSKNYLAEDPQRIEYWPYLRCISEYSDIIKLLKKDKIMAENNDGRSIQISSVYDGILYETQHEAFGQEDRYILLLGTWYKVENNFYRSIEASVSSIPISKLEFPLCGNSEKEGEYNKRVVYEQAVAPSMILLDCQNYVRDGRTKIEPCDILTSDLEFIHVKKEHGSSNLSHLFFQGLVSAKFFKQDPKYNEYISSKWKEATCRDDLKIQETPQVVYAIITSKETENIIEAIPFFSLVTLENTYQDLKAMDISCFIKLIHYEYRSNDDYIFEAVKEECREPLKELLAEKPGATILEKLKNTTDRELLKIPHVGEKSVNKIRERAKKLEENSINGNNSSSERVDNSEINGLE